MTNPFKGGWHLSVKGGWHLLMRRRHLATRFGAGFANVLRGRLALSRKRWLAPFDAPAPSRQPIRGRFYERFAREGGTFAQRRSGAFGGPGPISQPNRGRFCETFAREAGNFPERGAGTF